MGTLRLLHYTSTVTVAAETFKCALIYSSHSGAEFYETYIASQRNLDVYTGCPLHI